MLTKFIVISIVLITTISCEFCDQLKDSIITELTRFRKEAQHFKYNLAKLPSNPTLEVSDFVFHNDTGYFEISIGTELEYIYEKYVTTTNGEYTIIEGHYFLNDDGYEYRKNDDGFELTEFDTNNWIAVRSFDIDSKIFEASRFNDSMIALFQGISRHRIEAFRFLEILQQNAVPYEVFYEDERSDEGEHLWYFDFKSQIFLEEWSINSDTTVTHGIIECMDTFSQKYKFDGDELIFE